MQSTNQVNSVRHQGFLRNQYLVHYSSACLLTDLNADDFCEMRSQDDGIIFRLLFNKVYIWCNNNKMVINIFDSCDVLYSLNDKVFMLDLCLNSVRVPRKSFFNDLGVSFDKKYHVASHQQCYQRSFRNFGIHYSSDNRLSRKSFYMVLWSQYYLNRIYFLEKVWYLKKMVLFPTFRHQ